MSLVGEIGDLSETVRALNIEWKIPDLLSLWDETDSYRSPFFYYCDSKWNLRLYPNGETRIGAPEWMSLYIENMDFGSPVKLSYTLSVKELVSDQTFGEIPKLAISRGHKKFLRRSVLVPFLQYPVTLVLCLRCEDSYTRKGMLSDRLWDLSLDLKAFQNVEMYSDYTVMVEGHKFYCHRVILASRCPYFTGLFTSDVKENSTRKVEIKEMEATVFEYVLSYIYSGDLEGMSRKNVCKIYQAADRLLLEKLERLCVEFIKKNIDLNILYEVLSIADSCNDDELEECALDYFNRHTDDILDSQCWKKFKEEKSSDFVNEVLEKAMKKMSRNITSDSPTNTDPRPSPVPVQMRTRRFYHP